MWGFTRNRRVGNWGRNWDSRKGIVSATVTEGEGGSSRQAGWKGGGMGNFRSPATRSVFEDNFRKVLQSHIITFEAKNPQINSGDENLIGKWKRRARNSQRGTDQKGNGSVSGKTKCTGVNGKNSVVSKNRGMFLTQRILQLLLIKKDRRVGLHRPAGHNECFCMERSRMEGIRVQLGFTGKLVVDCEGRSGGLGLFWTDKVNVSLLSFSRFHIDVRVTSGANEDWRFTGFYGHPEQDQRSHAWTLLKRLQ
ncbi:hypothetical protein Ddye_030395 [Dipteronia dyeriana]|uniref:Uncharacterized protein n=1 Tax=Dipteronia dyeriana TaxID=168575 RepID=A0AAD9THA3_9ROSI|nr:hypothetical protein Ddye_030395 [Dipteronia dyeriana]